MKDAIAVRMLMFLTVISMLAGIYYAVVGLLTVETYTILLWLIFLTALIHLIWFYQVTKKHTRYMNRIAESSLLAAVTFNPILIFKVDIMLMIFLLGVFAWIFFIYAFAIGKIIALRKSGKIDWGEEIA